MSYDNTEFIVADAAVEMPKLYKAGVRPDVIVFDPIRAGCKEEVLTSAAGMEPKRIVYVSCNPATMARDIEILTHYGYELKRSPTCGHVPYDRACRSCCFAYKIMLINFKPYNLYEGVTMILRKSFIIFSLMFSDSNNCIC